MTMTGITGSPLEYLRTALSNSTNYQTLTGTESAAAALARIYLLQEAAENGTWPLSILTVAGEGLNGNRVTEGYGLAAYDSSQESVLRIEKKLTELLDNDQIETFVTETDAILKDILEYSAETMLQIHGYTAHYPAYYEDMKILFREIKFSWGFE